MPTAPGLLVHLLPDLLPRDGLDGGTAVVIDVLRATTVIPTALHAGCESVLPCVEIDEARSLAASMPDGRALLGGERLGLPIEGFDLGNSPAEYTDQVCRARTLVITTTNGTRAIRACRGARRIMAAGFVNLAATAHLIRQSWLDDPTEAVHLVCAGTDGQVSLEDTLLAGALAHVLSQRGDHPIPLANDAARLAIAVAPRAFDRLPALLRDGQGGRNLIDLGLAADVDFAARVDHVGVAAVLDAANPSAGFRRA
jgi:2-phosphosulfolactate phosphatase